MMAFWYHFAILFEALFILTACDAGTRAGRFMLQDLLGTFVPSFKQTNSWPANLTATGLCVAAWGYILYQGVVDPLGGINSLWPLFGISNQMLAGVALMLCTVVLFKMKRQQYAWVTIVPTVLAADLHADRGLAEGLPRQPEDRFPGAGQQVPGSLDKGELLAPAKSVEQMQQIVFNNYLDAVLAMFFIFVVVSILFYTIVACVKAWRASRHSRELPYEAIPTAKA
jgi:carbon starvation protein